MRKTTGLMLALLLCCASGFAFSRANDSDTAEGFINWFGNAPVEFAGFETTDGKLYTLAVEEGADFTLDDITALQGTKLHIEGRIEDKDKGGFHVLRDGVFVVSKFEKVK